MAGGAFLRVGNIRMVAGFVHRQGAGGTKFNADMAAFAPIWIEDHLTARSFPARGSRLGCCLFRGPGLCTCSHQCLMKLSCITLFMPTGEGILVEIAIMSNRLKSLFTCDFPHNSFVDKLSGDFYEMGILCAFYENFLIVLQGR
jgi:hypothetical protein